MLQDFLGPSGIGKVVAVVLLLLYAAFLCDPVFMRLAKAYSDEDSDSHFDIVLTWREIGLGGASLTVLVGSVDRLPANYFMLF